MEAFDPIKEARSNYAVYASIINSRYQMPPHVDIVIQMMESVERGEIDRGMISMPPRHSKSYTVTETFPAWYLGKHPDRKVIIVANVAELAKDMGDKIRTKIQSEEHQAIFPECKLTKSSKAKHNFKTTKGGEFFAVGVGGTLPGRGGHLIVIDDPLKGREEADSDVQRRKVHTYYEGVLYNRLEPDGIILLISTRWHEDDLAGFLLNPEKQEEVDNWHTLNLSAIAEKDEGWRKEGEALWKDRWPLKALQRIKRNSSQRTFAALYQGRPSAVEGIEIKRAWFRYYHWNPYLITRDDIARMSSAPFQIVQSWDFAEEDGPENDYTVGTTWLSTGSGEYLLDVVRRKMLTPESFRAVRESAIRWRPDLILCEQTSGGVYVVQQAQASTKLPILGIKIQGKGNKVFRTRGVSHMWETGRVFHPINAPWLKDYEDELVSFPTGANDDQLDSSTQFLHYIRMAQHSDEQMDLYAQESENATLFDSIDFL